MATIGNTFATVTDIIKLTDPDGGVATVVQLMEQTNEIIKDIPFQQCNDGSGHQTTQQVALPATTFRRFYEGVPYTKGATAQVRDTTAMMRQRSGVDEDLAKNSGDPVGFRTRMDDQHIVALGNDFATTVFYGNTDADPEQFHGLAPRYNSLSAPNADNIINASGSGSDNTSIWLLGLGDMTVHGIYPEGLPAGLSMQDMGSGPGGTRTINDASGNPYEIFDTKFSWNCGLAVPDWRFAIRICNIDLSDLVKTASSGADLVDLCMRAIALRPATAGLARWSFYANRSIISMLWRQVSNRATLAVTPSQVPGEMITTIGGIPVKRCDAILNTETVVA
jgi:hypothetical protein